MGIKHLKLKKLDMSLNNAIFKTLFKKEINRRSNFNKISMSCNKNKQRFQQMNSDTPFLEYIDVCRFSLNYNHLHF